MNKSTIDWVNETQNKIETEKKLKRKNGERRCVCMHCTLSEWIGMFDKREI